MVFVDDNFELKKSRFRDRNKCTKNETARLFIKDAEISRLDEKFARPTIFEVPFATPTIAFYSHTTHSHGHYQI